MDKPPATKKRSPRYKLRRAAAASRTYAGKVAAGLCIDGGCKAPAEEGKRRCRPCLDFQLQKARARQALKRP